MLVKDGQMGQARLDTIFIAFTPSCSDPCQPADWRDLGLLQT